MTELALSELDSTGPLVASVPAPVPVEVPGRAASSSSVVVDENLINISKRPIEVGLEPTKRFALLGLVLANLLDVPFATKAELLQVREARLVKLMHGEETIPQSSADKWQQVAEVLADLHSIIRPSATARWLETPIEALSGRTPLVAIKKGHMAAVREVVRGYRDSSFS